VLILFFFFAAKDAHSFIEKSGKEKQRKTKLILISFSFLQVKIESLFKWDFFFEIKFWSRFIFYFAKIKDLYTH
jgi:hypothetical protein